MDELEFAARQTMPIHVQDLPRGTTDLGFLARIADRITDLRISSATIESVATIATMTSLRHLWIDDQLKLPPIEIGGLVELRTYSGTLALAPDLLTLPALIEADVSIRAKEPLRLKNGSLRALRTAYEPRSTSFAGIEGQSDLHTLGLAGIRDLALTDVPHFVNLEQLDLARIGVLRDVAALHRFTRLKKLTLTDVRHVDVDLLGHLDCNVELLRTLPRADRAALTLPPNVTLLE